MLDAVPKLSDAVTHYASYRLRANMQCYAIEKKESMIIDPSIIYMTTKKRFAYIGRDRLIIMVKKARVCWELWR